VKLYNVFKTGEALVVQDEAAVEEKFGCRPDQVVDVLAIMGDASDNVPGVKGIGEKGAIQLIQKFGSVQGVLEHLDELTPKQREKIEASSEALRLSRELVTIDVDVPLEPGLSAVGPAAPDPQILRPLFERLQFRSLLESLEGGQQGAQLGEERDYVTVHDLEGLAAMEAELREAGAFAFDTETTSLFPLAAELVGMSFSASAGRAFYLPFNAFPPVHPKGPSALLEAVTPLLTDPGLARWAQNAKYDWLVLAGQGVSMPDPDFDTMVASFSIAGSTRPHNLDALALHYFDLSKIPTKDLIGSGAKQITMADVPVEQVAEYACEDADVTFRLRGVLEPELDASESRHLFETLEMPLVPVLMRMEQRGIRLDEQLLADYSVELTKAIAEAEGAVHDAAGEVFKINSTKVLGQILFEKLEIQNEAGVKRVKRTKTGYSTDAATLRDSYGDVPIVRALLEYRELTKLKSTYVDALPRYVDERTGRIHCSFSQVSAATGRLASSDPNLQNIPVRTERGRRLRKAFVPCAPDERGEWIFLAADYSQIELRVMAHLSGDELMIQAFSDGRDIHASTASVIFGCPEDEVDRAMRSKAKVINFGLLYGMGPQRVARETDMTVPEAKEFIERYFAAFPTVRDWMDRTLEAARETGYAETLMGRRRRIPDIDSGNPRQRSFAENAALNTPVQGSAADIIKRAMIDMERRLQQAGLAARMLLQVHDELLFELPLSELEATRKVVVEGMEGAFDLAVPLAVDCGTGSNWLEAH
jgi:DNA polymerase I